MTEEERYETVTLHSPGPIAGIPGQHAAGNYTIDWLERTLTPIVEQTEPTPEQSQPAHPPEQPIPETPAQIEQEVAHLTEEIHAIEEHNQPQA